jgi:transcriptional regulator with GAF, ATPase, and Fis domain
VPLSLELRTSGSIRASLCGQVRDDAARVRQWNVPCLPWRNGMHSKRNEASRAGLVIRDEGVRQLFRMAESVATSTISVLILGESGTGKEKLAETVHAHSSRRSRPFLRLNCGALPESILEGELFGYERGAFTGALQAKPGLFEAADGGTVFLDEVGDLPLSTQSKLLRVLEGGEVLRLGGRVPLRVDVRFVSATNLDLQQRVATGHFRLDLYFRINGISLTVPPLRERPLDIEALAELFLERFTRATGKRDLVFSAEATALLAHHSWPGNIRELRNVVERAVLLCGSNVVGPEQIRLTGCISTEPPPSSQPGRTAPTATPSLQGHAAATPATSLRGHLAEVERQRILDALHRCAGNQSRAAQSLGISRRSLLYKLDLHGIDRPRKAPTAKGPEA